jgi:hypothetical protein
MAGLIRTDVTRHGQHQAEPGREAERQEGAEAAASQKTLRNLPKSARTAPGKQGAAVARRERTGASAPKTRAELYELARQRDQPGRSKMGRDELARRLGEK